MSSIVMVMGGLHFYAKHSKEDSVGRGRGDSTKFCRCMTARPPP